MRCSSCGFENREGVRFCEECGGKVESLPTSRLLLLVNYRPEYQHGWGRKTYYTQLRLDALPPESAGELLGALLGDDPGLEPLKRLLVKRGNPFFIEESVRTLVETGALTGERGAYRLTRPIQAIEVPATVQVTVQSREVRNVDDFDGVFVAIKRERPDALLTLVDPVTFAQRNLIAEFAARERLPAMYAIREFVEAGGLMSYGVDLRDLFRRGATYVDKILKGAKPGDLPIEQTTKFELVINLKTAKAPRPDDPAIALDVLRFDCRHFLEPISAPTDQQPSYWTEFWPGTGKEGGATSLAWP